jgi:ketosteroid isomerase-like protein
VTITGDGRVVFIEGYGDVIMTNGRRYRNRYVMRVTVEGDRVATTREYYNPIISARAFGRDIGSGDEE